LLIILEFEQNLKCVYTHAVSLLIHRYLKYVNVQHSQKNKVKSIDESNM